MLLSMTGYGDARHHDAQLAAVVEVRSVNNRYLKLVGKYPEWLAPQEGEIERRVRQIVGRGTVTLQIRVDRIARAEDFQLNRVALESYWGQIQQSARELHAPPPTDLGQLLVLDGVVVETRHSHSEDQGSLDLTLQLLDRALERFQAFRIQEGAAMARDLERNLGVITTQLEEVARQAPLTVVEYRAKLLDRVRQAISETGVTLSETDLIREVAIYADRGDINEEITRLRSHLSQFATFLVESASTGRKLDFLSQEMFREINTIGSKANHVGIAHAVVEMKAALEKIREVLQNVE